MNGNQTLDGISATVAKYGFENVTNLLVRSKGREAESLLVKLAGVSASTEFVQRLPLLAESESKRERGNPMEKLTKEEKERLIDKIRKLMALSHSPNEHEAALAAARAREILDKYDLSLTEVEMNDEEIIEHRVETGTKEPPLWMGRLALYVGKAFNCRIFRLYGMMVFCGTKADTQVSEFTYTFLFRTVKRLCKEHKASLEKSGIWNAQFRGRSGSRTYMKSYALGVVNAIDQKLREFVQSRDRMQKFEDFKKATGKDLVVIKNQAVDRYCEKLHLRHTQSHARVDYSGFEAGRRDGRSVQIHHGVNGANDTRYLR